MKLYRIAVFFSLVLFITACGNSSSITYSDTVVSKTGLSYMPTVVTELQGGIYITLMVCKKDTGFEVTTDACVNHSVKSEGSPLCGKSPADGNCKFQVVEFTQNEYNLLVSADEFKNINSAYQKIKSK